MITEVKKSFVEASTSEKNDKLELDMDSSMLTTFLETCMKLLHYSKVVEGLQELINRCVGTALGELCVVHKIIKNQARTGREMRLTEKIGEYEMDQAILDLGSSVMFY